MTIGNKQQTADDMLAKMFNATARHINEWAKQKGFWDVPKAIMDAAETEPKAFAWMERLIKSQKMALVTTETSEAIEALRKPDAPSGVEGFSNEVEEQADQIIRILDYCGQYKLPIGECIVAKMAVNEGRPHKHGKHF